MPDSTARRERLANPSALVLLAAVFALAFAALLPQRDAFRSRDQVDAGVDAVEIAYLRARAAAGESVGPEIRRLVSGLLAGGRPVDARALLTQFPDTRLDARTAFLLELEGAAAALVAGNGAAPTGGVPDPGLADALSARLERLRDEPALQDPATLARGAWLSRRLPRPALTATLHARLAAADPARASASWTECGASAAAAGARALAVDCYRRAIDALVTSAPADGRLVDADTLGDTAFDLRLALLGQLTGDEDEVARSGTVDALLAHESRDADRLETLARTLLAVERPGAAADVYGDLGALDPAGAATWWSEAARWSEAAGRPARAAAWVDRLAGIAGSAERPRLARRVEALLLAAGREAEALERVAARIAANPGDAGALRDGIRLARRGGDVARAGAWNEDVLERAPDDAVALRLAIDLALADADLAAARAAAERAVHRLPDDRPARVRLAQIAEWSGEPAVATAQWRILAASDPDGATLRELVRLAELTLQPDVAADAAHRLALLAPPSAADLERVVELYELDGRPDTAAAAVESIIATHRPTPASLETLARLHERHARLRDALDAWERRARLVGRTTPAGIEGTLARVALHWRLNERDAAGALVDGLRGVDLGDVDATTATLLSGIAWRERKTWLALAVAPAIAALDDPGQRSLHGRRLVGALGVDGDFDAAIAEADRLWRETGDAAFAITAMNLALEGGRTAAASAYLVAGAITPDLGAEPGYWTAAAALRLGEDDVDAARRGYERALELDPDDAATLAALLWLLVDAGEQVELERLLDAHDARAVDEPALWSVFALARLGLGRPEASLAWFERLSDRIGTDYGLLLGYADALESSGRVDDALRLRRHALDRLRPALTDALGTPSAVRETLLREYARLAGRYDALDARWAGVLLDGETGGDAADRWREDVVIAWLLSSERHEHARLVMARLHGERAGTPAWQALAVALASRDLSGIGRVLASGERLSVADRILALRAVGREREAFAIAGRAMRDDPLAATRDFAAEQYAEMRGDRPNWAEGFVAGASQGTLDTGEVGVAARHTFARSDFGLSLRALRASLASDTLDLDGRRQRGDVGVSLLNGDARRGLHLDLGVESGMGSGDDDALVRIGGGVYVRSRDGRRELAAEVMLAEVPTESPELRLAARRDRASIELESALGNREFARLQADATELRTRGAEDFVARGTFARAELGVRGAVGGTEWSASVQASHARHERAGALPDELALSDDATLDTVLAPRTTLLGLGGSIVHGGGVGTGFPRTGAPRWYADASVDHGWPDRSFGLRVNTGVGLRVLGGDELAFSLSHDTRARTGSRTRGADGSALGVAYRYHF